MTTTATQSETAPRWDIDAIFPGGSESAEYADFVNRIAADLESLQADAKKLPADLNGDGCAAWAAWILRLQDLAERVHLAGAHAMSLTSQDVNDAKAAALVAESVGLDSRWQVLQSSLEAFSIRVSDADWDQLMASDGLVEVRFTLDRMRDIASSKMPEALENLALSLAVDGYHAWNMNYEKMAGDLRVIVSDNGESHEMSLGQNAARFSDPDRNVRRDAFVKMEGAWESRAELAAITLNAQAGFRLALYRNRKWDSALHEPLLHSRMEEATLDAMWASIKQHGSRLKEYVDAKKRLLGIDRFCWYDQGAPAGKMEQTFSFDEAGDFIVEHIGSFSEEMGKFTRQALDARWVEAENRPGKRAGGWCSWMPIRKQARIFMTFAPNYEGLSTLAHEFGHAYHGYVLRDEPAFVSSYPMTLAETASIFNELRIADAALAQTENPQQKLALLDQGLQSTLVFFCNIHARYMFDRRFYVEREKGIVGRARLDELMREVQKEAFFGMLDEDEGYHPLFWASKLHFFITSMPFYNYPYTFGFLFAKGVYDRAVAEGPSFARAYRSLLADTGRMTTEDVARKHLGVDLTKPEFWDDVVKRCLDDIDPFVALCG